MLHRIAILFIGLFFSLGSVASENLVEQNPKEFTKPKIDDALLGQEGNGGAGVAVDGRFVTFYSAGIYTKKRPEVLEDIPGLKDLLHEFNSFPGLSTYAKTFWFSSLRPTSTRKYYKVLKEQVDPEAIEKLKGKYEEELGFENNNPIGIFAITDKKTKTTLLLPGFYKLNKYEQMAILFHEAYWLNFPDDDYVDVVNAEITFQEYLETKDPLTALEFLKSIKRVRDSLFFVVDHDMKSSDLNERIEDNKILAVDFFGEDFLTCMSESPRADRINYCRQFLTEHFYNLNLAYPNSLLAYLAPLFVYQFSGNSHDTVINEYRYKPEILLSSYMILEKDSKNDFDLTIYVEYQPEGATKARKRKIFEISID